MSGEEALLSGYLLAFRKSLLANGESWPQLFSGVFQLTSTVVIPFDKTALLPETEP